MQLYNHDLAHIWQEACLARDKKYIVCSTQNWFAWSELILSGYKTQHWVNLAT